MLLLQTFNKTLRRRETIGEGKSKENLTEDLRIEALAREIGVSTSFIGHIERGSRVPSVETLWRICQALECSMDFVVVGE